MSYQKVNYQDVEPVADAMHFLGEPLESEQLGVTMVRCKPGWRGLKHDHTDNQHEEIYVCIDGGAEVTIDEETVAMEPGDALWIPPEATRQLQNGDDESAFVLVSAPSTRQEPTDPEEGWLVHGFIG